MITVQDLKKYLNLPDEMPEGYDEILSMCIKASVSEMNIFTNRELVTLNDELEIILPVNSKLFFL